MRRGVGVGGLHAANKAKEHYKAVGEEVKHSTLEAMKGQMSQFRMKLEEFALKHREDIRRDPAFRAQFHAMCAHIGVDPLASNKGVWAKALGIGDYYFELGVQIIEACWATREANGGLLEVPTLLRLVNKRRGSHAEPATLDDMLRSIKKLKVLGSGFDVLQIGKQQFVRSVPGELNTDSNHLIEMAQAQQGHGGYLTKSFILSQPGWHKVRTEAALGTVLAQGLALVDDQGSPGGGERLYWFPCLLAAPATQ